MVGDFQYIIKSIISSLIVKLDRFLSIPISTPFLGVTLPLDFIPTFIFYFITFRATSRIQDYTASAISSIYKVYGKKQVTIADLASIYGLLMLNLLLYQGSNILSRYIIIISSFIVSKEQSRYIQRVFYKLLTYRVYKILYQAANQASKKIYIMLYIKESKGLNSLRRYL